MKELTLIKTIIPKNVDLGIAVDAELDYRKQLLQCICIPPAPENPMSGAQGWTLDDMLASDSLVEKIKGAEYPDVGGAIVLIEDAEHKVLVEKLAKSRFMIHSSEIVTMLKHFKEPPEVDINAIQ